MSRPTVFVSKFVGVTTLGLLTGTSLTLCTTTLPSLLRLPTLPPALATFTAIRQRTTLTQRLLSSLSLTAVLFAYTLSPRGARHPYLLWTGATVVLGQAVDIWLGSVDRYEDDEDRDEREINGEVVRESVEGWRLAQGVKGILAGLGFGMSVIGIWGDGY